MQAQRRAGADRQIRSRSAQILRGLSAVLLAASVSACAGLYPALYTAPEVTERRDVPERSSDSTEPLPSAQADATVGSAAVDAEIRSITVATLNMLHGLPRFEYLDERKQLLAAELERLAPDVVLLQEVPVLRNRTEQIGPWLADSLGYSLVYGRANGRAAWLGFEEGVAVLSRYPILQVQRHVLLPKPGLVENRIVLRAVIDTPLGVLEVYNTHFSHRVYRDPLRLKQGKDLIHFLRETYRYRDLPAVIGGDFNALPDSDPVDLLLEQGLKDAALLADPPAVGPTSWFQDITDPGDGPKVRIDYLFLFTQGAERRVTVRSCTRFLDHPFRTPNSTPTEWLWASDHVGLICELVVE